MKVFQFSDNADRRRDDVADAAVTFLCQPDMVLPFQYFQMIRGNPYRESEKRLILAVLEDAVNCFQKYYSAQDRKGRKLFQQTDEWFRSKGQEWPFSFENVCQTLAINPDYLRRGLFEWKER